MSVISMKQLLEAGVHFGHQTRRWNPKMAPYIYTERNGIYIIDLQKSVGKVDEAYKAVSDIVAEGGTILFVGTKKQAQDAITDRSRALWYVLCKREMVRWYAHKLQDNPEPYRKTESRSRQCLRTEHLMFFRRRKLSSSKKEWDKLEKNLGGIKEMKKTPGCYLHRRSEERKNLRTGSSYTGYSADRYRRYQL